MLYQLAPTSSTLSSSSTRLSQKRARTSRTALRKRSPVGNKGPFYQIFARQRVHPYGNFHEVYWCTVPRKKKNRYVPFIAAGVVLIAFALQIPSRADQENDRVGDDVGTKLGTTE
jgi:hypothetical protein